MLHLVDAIDYTANAGMVPVVAAMGDKDPYFSSHLLIEKAFAKEGIPFNGLVDHGAGHGITPAVFQEQINRLDELAVRGSDPFPKHIRFVTWTLKFSRCRWIEVLGLDGTLQARRDRRPHRRRRLHHSSRTAEHHAICHLSSGSVGQGRFGDDRRRPDRAARVEQRRRSSGRFRKARRKLDLPWALSIPVTLTGKRPGLQGPIDDAFARPFLCVRGTGKAWNPAVASWADANLRRFADEWRRHYRGYLPVKNDTDVTEDDVRRSNLILFGDPGSNLWIGKVLPQLPIQWTRDTLQLGAEKHSAADHGVELIYPNPLPGADGRYVVLNSGHTYHDAELRFSYMVFPRLGDWAVMKVGDNPAATPAPPVAETVVNSGFFDEAWAFPVSR